MTLPPLNMLNPIVQKYADYLRECCEEDTLAARSAFAAGATNIAAMGGGMLDGMRRGLMSEQRARYMFKGTCAAAYELALGAPDMDMIVELSQEGDALDAAEKTSENLPR